MDTEDIQIIVNIFESDLDELLDKAELVADHVEWIQIDIADNTLVSNESFRDFIKLKNEPRWKRLLEMAQFEAHLMVDKPCDYLPDLIEAGFTRVIAHVECQDPREFIEEALSYECEVGLSIDADTEVEALAPFLEELDVMHVMTVDAGFSGQPFRADTVEKIRTIHKEFPTLPIEVDGHMNPDTAKVVKDAGATRIGATTFIFEHEDGVEQAIQELLEA